MRAKLHNSLIMTAGGIILEICAIGLAHEDKLPKLFAVAMFIAGVAMLGYGVGKLADWIRIKSGSQDVSMWSMILIAVVSVLSGLAIRFIV